MNALLLILGLGVGGFVLSKALGAELEPLPLPKVGDEAVLPLTVGDGRKVNIVLKFRQVGAGFGFQPFGTPEAQTVGPSQNPGFKNGERRNIGNRLYKYFSGL